MFTILHLGLLTFLLFLTVSLRAEDAPTPEAPPTPEEVQKAVQELSKLFSPIAAPTPAPVKPEWYPLKPEDAKRVDEVLSPWGESRAKGGGVRCQFRQWEFDPAYGPKDPAIPYVYTMGEFRWDAPDVWMWRGTSSKKSVVHGAKTEWVNIDPSNWARNKTTFYELDYRRMTLIERHFPEGSADIPPFAIFGFMVGPFTSSADLFRLDPAGLQDRFWIRPVTVTTGKNERWLELFPKTVADARRFSSLLVAISESDWEVCALDIRAPNYSAQKNPAHTSIEFLNRTRPTAASGLITKVIACSDICVPSVPPGWKKVIEDRRDLPVKK